MNNSPKPNIINTPPNSAKRVVVVKPNSVVTTSSKVVAFAKNTYDTQRKKINKDNVIYYFVGFTLMIILFIYVVPIIYFNLTKKQPDTIKIGYTQTSKVNLSTIEKPKQNNIDLSIVAPKKAPVKNIKVATREEMLKIFQQILSERTNDKLIDYLESESKLFLFQATKTKNCCVLENTTIEYVASILPAINTEKVTWNFDQNQPDIKKVQDIANRFNDNFIGISNTGVMVGIKISVNNKITELNVANNIQGVYDSNVEYKEGDFEKAYNAANQ
jgi:hypothetical protein